MKVISSKLKITYVLIIIIGSLAFCLIATHFLIGLENNDPAVIGTGYLFAMFGSYGFSLVIRLKELSLVKKGLEIKSFFSSKIIPYNEIYAYTEIEKSSEHSTWKDLTILTKKGQFTISSGYFTNYKNFKSRIARIVKNDTKAEKEWHQKQNKRYALGFTIFGVLFPLFIWYLNIREERTLTTGGTLVLFLISLFSILYAIFNLKRK